MSHDTHTSHDLDNRPTTSFRSAFWLVIILAGLFIAAVNFVKIESSSDETNNEATSSETMKGESGTGKAIETHNEAAPAIQPSADTTQTQAH